jgi:hypothetical protein
MPKPRQRRGPAIAFDAAARQEHLRGFSARKQQRRAYGLAMQAVKDRAGRVAERQERREVDRERIAQAEQAKEEWLEAAWLESSGGATTKDDEAAVAVAAMARAVGATKKSERNKRKAQDDDEEEDTAVPMKNGGETAADATAATIVQTYADQQTEQQWGGTVVVTIGSAIPDSDDEDEDMRQVAARAKKKPRSRKDEAQEFAGTVDRFLQESKGRSKTSKAHKHKGKHGSADMRGVGGAGGLKVAQSFLKRSKGMKKDSKHKDSKKKGRR